MATPDVDMEGLQISFPVASEAPYLRHDWSTDSDWKEVLKCTPEAVDLTRLNGGASVLKNHDDDDVIGTVVKAWLEDARVWVRVQFRKADENIKALFDDVAAGILRNVSIGYTQDQIERDGEYGYVTRWTPLEVSMVVGVPADPTVGVYRSDDRKRVTRMVTETDEFVSDDSGEKPAKKAEPQGTQGETGPEGGKGETGPQAPKEDKGCEQEPSLKEVMDELKKVSARLDLLEDKPEPEDAGQPEFITDDAGEKPADPKEKECDGADEIRALAAVAGCPEEAENAIKRGVTPVAFREHLKTLNLNTKGNKEMSEKYSLLRALQGAVGMNVDDSVERRASDEVYAQSGLQPSTKNSFMYRANEFIGTGTGAGMIGTDHRGDLFIEKLRPRMGVRGYTLISGLRSNVEIPAQTAYTEAELIGINSALTGQTPSVGKITLSPKKFGATVTVALDLIAQSNPDAVAFVMRDIEAQIARKLDAAILKGNVSPAIAGVAGTTGVQTVTIPTIASATWADMLKFYGKIGEYDLATLPAWVMSAADAQTMKGISKGAGGGRFVMEDGRIDGYDVNVSGMIQTGDIFFGSWSDVLVGQWGGLEMIVDPYTQAASGMLVITARLLADIAVRNPQGFVMRVASDPSSSSSSSGSSDSSSSESSESSL